MLGFTIPLARARDRLNTAYKLAQKAADTGSRATHYELQSEQDTETVKVRIRSFVHTAGDPSKRRLFLLA